MSKWFRWDCTDSWKLLLEAFPSSTADSAEVLPKAEQLYNGIAVFHGCRPLNIETYLRDGVQPIPLERLRAIARGAIQEAFPDAPTELIELAIEQAPKPTQPPHVYACVDARELFRGANGFSARGSEYVQIVLIELRCICGHDFPDPLEKRGRPAILELGIKWPELSSYIRKELGLSLKSGLDDIRRGEELAPRQWCHTQVAAIAPQQILKVHWLDESDQAQPFSAGE